MLAWRDDELYAVVRFARLVQVGHFMMGSVRVGPDRIVLSGSYGSDGLPVDYDKLSPRAQARFTRLAPEDASAYWHPKHSGHNSTGSEAYYMRMVGLRIMKGTYPG